MKDKFFQLGVNKSTDENKNVLFIIKIYSFSCISNIAWDPNGTNKK